MILCAVLVEIHSESNIAFNLPNPNTTTVPIVFEIEKNLFLSEAIDIQCVTCYSAFASL